MTLRKKSFEGFAKLIFIFLLFELSGYFQLIPIWVFKITKITPQIEVLLSCFSNLILLMILFFIYRISLRNDWKNFTKNISHSIDSCFKYWSLGLVGMMVSNIMINSILKLGQAENEQLVQGMIGSLPLVMLLNAGIIAPIIEELIFRKAFFDAFKKKWMFILVSGLVFGLMHIVVATSLVECIYFIPYSCLGIAFAYMYYDTNSVFVPIFAHMFHNSILVLVSILM